MALEFVHPGKPIQNAVMESSHGRMRDELLTSHRWRDVAEVRDVVKGYHQDFNEIRPHSAPTTRRRPSSRGALVTTSTRRDWHRALCQLWGNVTPMLKGYTMVAVR